jgi:hypothetical protein
MLEFPVKDSDYNYRVPLVFFTARLRYPCGSIDILGTRDWYCGFGLSDLLEFSLFLSYSIQEKAVGNRAIWPSIYPYIL